MLKITGNVYDGVVLNFKNENRHIMSISLSTSETHDLFCEINRLSKRDEVISVIESGMIDDEEWFGDYFQLSGEQQDEIIDIATKTYVEKCLSLQSFFSDNAEGGEAIKALRNTAERLGLLIKKTEVPE